MKQQFLIKKIKKDIYKITEPYYQEHANMFLIRGQKFSLLVDCGLGLFNIRKFLYNKGFKNVEVFITHAHFDHIGGLKYFYPAQTIVTSEVCHNLKYKELWGVNHFKVKHLNNEYLRHNTSFIPGDILGSLDILVTQFKSYQLTKIDLGNYIFDIIKTPGHTDDSTILYEPGEKILITGDVLYNGQIYANLQNSNLQDYKQTLARLSQMDFDLVLPGHNNIVDRGTSIRIIKDWSRNF